MKLQQVYNKQEVCNYTTRGVQLCNKYIIELFILNF